MRISKHKPTIEIENNLQKAAKYDDLQRSSKLQNYLGTQLKVLGLNAKTQVDVLKNGFDFYSDSHEKTFTIFDKVYKNAQTHEGKSQAFIYLDKYYKYIPLEIQLQVLPSWIKHVDNWAHSDYLSKFLTRLLEHPSTEKELLKTIHAWNKSSNHWERRQSLVSLYYYARTKTKHVDYAVSEKLIRRLIQDKEYFVQKAVGWTLRESYNVYPTKTYQFIEEHIKQISSTAFTTCIEKMPNHQKQSLKQKRR